MNKMKNSTKSICSRADGRYKKWLAEEELWNNTFTTEQREKNKEQRKPTWSMGFNQKGRHFYNQDSRKNREGEGGRNLFKETVAKNFPSLGKDLGSMPKKLTDDCTISVPKDLLQDTL